jgi:two-component system, OmpR family, sensor histidine kinase BaeS
VSDPKPPRADRGRRDAWGPWGRADRDWRDPFAREMRARARLAHQRQRQQMRRQGNHSWRRRQGFGCLFGLLALIVIGSVVAVIASLLSSLGPVPVVLAIVAAVTIIGAAARGLFGAGRDLDRLLGAVRRVEDGDYTVRLGKTRSDIMSIQELAAGFDTMVERLETDEVQRRTLLADVSHELRTPLAVITGSIEAIVDGVYPADAAHLGPILEETRVLERLIEDLRTVALSEAGTLTLHPEPTDPDILIADVVRSFGAAADAAGVTIVTAVDGDLPILELDPVRMREVLSNLVSNALRHTPSGGTITVGGSATPNELVLRVTDTGPGIDPALLPHVFDRFVKGETSRGSGLGLAIARGLVQAHGGTISAASPAGGGTTFRVTLPRPTGG